MAICDSRTGLRFSLRWAFLLQATSHVQAVRTKGRLRGRSHKSKANGPFLSIIRKK